MLLEIIIIITIIIVKGLATEHWHGYWTLINIFVVLM